MAHFIPSSEVKDYFTIDDYIGTEDRTTEFKLGRGFIDNDFRKNVAKYMSAFINGQQNGKLMIGVDNHGVVVGHKMTPNEEDRGRQQIDEAFRDISPAVHTRDYHITFVPVHDKHGKLLVTGGKRTVVIKLVVDGSQINKMLELYHTPQGTFMRRDASVSKLTGQNIEELTRRSNQLEVDRQLADRDQRIQRLQEQLNNFQSNHLEVDRQLADRDQQIQRLQEQLKNYHPAVVRDQHVHSLQSRYTPRIICINRYKAMTRATILFIICVVLYALYKLSYIYY